MQTYGPGCCGRTIYVALNVQHNGDNHSVELLYSICLLPNGRQALIASDIGLHYIDLSEQRVLRQWVDESGGIRCIDITPDAMRAVTISNTGIVSIWNLCEWASHKLSTSAPDVAQVQISADGKYLVTWSYDHVWRILDITGDAYIRESSRIPMVINDFVTTWDLSLAVTGGNDCTVRVFDLSCNDIPEHANRCVGDIPYLLSPRFNRALSIAHTEILIHDLLRGSRDLVSWHDMSHTSSVSDTISVPSPTSLVSNYNGTIVICGFDNGRIQRIVTDSSDIITLICSEKAIKVLATDLAGFRIVAGMDDGIIMIWSHTDETPYKLGEHDEEVTAIVMHPDGTSCVSGGYDGSVYMWDIASGAAPIRFLDKHNLTIAAIAVAWQNGRIITSAWDRTVLCWNLQDASELIVLDGHQDIVTCITITPDGMFAITGCDDQTIRAWRLDNGACLAVFPTDMPVTALSTLEPDGLFLCTTADGKVHKLKLANLPTDLHDRLSETAMVSTICG